MIIHRKRYDDWTLPKGKLEPANPSRPCAVREVAEETGVTIRLGVPLDTIRYEVRKAGIKQVDYWAGVVLELGPPRTRRRGRRRLLAADPGGAGRLTYAHDHFLVEQFLEQPPTTPLILVRHAQGDGPQGLVAARMRPAAQRPRPPPGAASWSRC